MVSNEERRSIDQLIERLTAKHSGIGREQITSIVTAAHDTFSSAKIRDFVPLFVERRAEVLLTEHRSGHSAATG